MLKQDSVKRRANESLYRRVVDARTKNSDVDLVIAMVHRAASDIEPQVLAGHLQSKSGRVLPHTPLELCTNLTQKRGYESSTLVKNIVASFYPVDMNPEAFATFVLNPGLQRCDISVHRVV